MFLSPGTIPILNYTFVIIAIALGAGSSASINMWFDEDIDKNMERTKTRPIPLGIVTKNEALVLGILTGVVVINLNAMVFKFTCNKSITFYNSFYIFIYTFW